MQDANQNKDAWDRLIEFEVAKDKLVALTDPTKGPRQDNIPSGIVADFDKQSLNENATNASFDGAEFYDLEQYSQNSPSMRKS